MNSGKVKIQKGGKEKEVAETERGERGEEQKGKLVHAMIMVVNHKSDNLLQKQTKKSQHSQTKLK